MRRLVLLLMSGLGTAAHGEIADGQGKAIDTRFGRVQVVPVDSYAEGLTFNGALLSGVSNRWLWIAGGWSPSGEAHDWVLVSSNHGGNMCPTEFVALKIAAAGIARTESFGSCLGDDPDVTFEPGRMIVTLHDPALDVERRRFAFDGATLTDTAIAAATAPAAGAGADALRWVGRSGYEVLEDAGERARFAQILPGDLLADLLRRVTLGNAARQVGGWVVGTGCQPHQCNVHAGLWAIRIADGRPAAVFFDEGNREQWYGVDPRTPEGAELLGVAAETRLP